VKAENTEESENVETCAIRSSIQTTEKLTSRDHMQKGERSRRHGKHRQQMRSRNGLKWAQAGWPSPFRAPFAAPFDLDDPRAIYSPPAKSHASIHLPFTAEKQRREGHHFGEERVELVV
jgi:hypothetical protein